MRKLGFKRLLPIIGGLLGLAGLWLILTARQPQTQELPFETISQGIGFPTGRSYSGEDPNLLVITAPEAVDAPGLEIQFTPELAEQLRTLDYDRYFAILVLQGHKNIIGYQVTIQQVIRQGNQINIQVEFVEPAPETLILPAFSSPYHLIAVSKTGTWGEQFQFVLVNERQSVAETTYLIP